MRNLDMTKTNKRARYVPPDSAVIRDYAYQVCADLKSNHNGNSRQEIITGLSAFLEFIAQTSVKYLNGDHRDYLMRGYTQKSYQGAHNVKEKNTSTNAA